MRSRFCAGNVGSGLIYDVEQRRHRRRRLVRGRAVRGAVRIVGMLKAVLTGAYAALRPTSRKHRKSDVLDVVVAPMACRVSRSQRINRRQG